MRGGWLISGKNIEAVLFDLDNTLIYFDERRFFSWYGESLHQHFADVFSPEQLRERIYKTSLSMLVKDGRKTNVEHFLSGFASDDTLNEEECLERFNRFYDETFDSFREHATFHERAHEIVSFAKDAGFKTVIATNPYWPEHVQMKRLKWGGLHEIDYDLITHAFNMHYVKPSENYYLEICEYIDTPPEKCLMIGNDGVNDIIAQRTGMTGFLIENGTLRTTDVSRSFNEKVLGDKLGEIPEPHYRGTLMDAHELLKKAAES